MQFYGFENPYGLSTLNTAGTQANKITRFESQKDRDRWVDQDPSKRKPLSANKALVKEAKKQAALGLDWPIKL